MCDFYFINEKVDGIDIEKKVAKMIHVQNEDSLAFLWNKKIDIIEHLQIRRLRQYMKKSVINFLKNKIVYLLELTNEDQFDTFQDSNIQELLCFKINEKLLKNLPKSLESLCFSHYDGDWKNLEELSLRQIVIPKYLFDTIKNLDSYNFKFNIVIK